MKYAFANWRCDGIDAAHLEELDLSKEDLQKINSWLSIEECEIVPETDFDVPENYTGVQYVNKRDDLK